MNGLALEGELHQLVGTEQWVELMLTGGRWPAGYIDEVLDGVVTVRGRDAATYKIALGAIEGIKYLPQAERRS